MVIFGKALARLDFHEPRYGARRSPVMEEAPGQGSRTMGELWGV